MNNQQKTILFDGEDEIVLSQVLNIYENVLIVKNIYGFNLKFLFQDKLPTLPPELPEKDISISSEEKEVTITLSAKFRNTLGSGTSTKIPIISFQNGKKLLFSIYGSKVGDNTSALNIALTFYLR